MNKRIEVEDLKEWIDWWFKKNEYYHPYANRKTIPVSELYDIIDRMPAASNRIYDYRIEDLALLAEFLHSEGITEENVRHLIEDDIKWIFTLVKRRFDEEMTKAMNEVGPGLINEVYKIK